MIYRVMDAVVNIFRSIPFLILMILVIPLTRLIAGKAYGSTATIVPLVIAAAPYVARMIESSLLEVDPGVIEAAQSMGASVPEYSVQGLAYVLCGFRRLRRAVRLYEHRHRIYSPFPGVWRNMA